eukprot:766991-Hanusia_phi.AAC.7
MTNRPGSRGFSASHKFPTLGPGGRYCGSEPPPGPGAAGPGTSGNSTSGVVWTRIQGVRSCRGWSEWASFAPSAACDGVTTMVSARARKEDEERQERTCEKELKSGMKEVDQGWGCKGEEAVERKNASWGCGGEWKKMAGILVE